MAKVFNKDLFGTKTAVILGSKYERLAEIVGREFGSTSKNNVLSYGEDSYYAVSLKTGEVHGTDWLLDVGYEVLKWNNCLIEKTEKTNTTTTKNTISGGKTMKNTNKTLGGLNMEKLFGRIGKVSADEVRFTMSGTLAFFDAKNDRWLSFDKDNSMLVDNMNLTVDFEGAIAMPARQSDLAVGDLIITPFGGFGFVSNINPLRVMTKSSTVQTVKQIGNVLGMETYFTKITPIIGGAAAGFNPMLMLALADDELDAQTLVLMNAMQNGTFNIQNNPMLLMALAGDSGLSKETLLMMSMMNGGGLDMSNPMTMMALLGDSGIDTKSLMLMNAMGGGDNAASNPMLMAMMLGGSGKGKLDAKTLLMMNMANGGTGTGLDMKNPMTMMMLLGDKIDAKLMMIMNALQQQTVKVEPVAEDKPVAETTTVSSPEPKAKKRGRKAKK